MGGFPEPGVPILWSVAPEDISLGPGGAVEATVLDVADLGTSTEVTVRAGGLDLVARSPVTGTAPDPGMKCRLHLPQTLSECGCQDPHGAGHDGNSGARARRGMSETGVGPSRGRNEIGRLLRSGHGFAGCPPARTVTVGVSASLWLGRSADGVEGACLVTHDERAVGGEGRVAVDGTAHRQLEQPVALWVEAVDIAVLGGEVDVATLVDGLGRPEPFAPSSTPSSFPVSASTRRSWPALSPK